MKRKIFIIATILLIILSCFLITFRFLIPNDKKNSDKIIVNNLKYLNANFAMMIYSELDEYIEENVELKKLEVNQFIEIPSGEIIEGKDEYEKCNGILKIEKLINDVYSYEISSNCLNATEETLDLKIKVYTNINQNSNYQVINKLKKCEDGYIGTLVNYKLNNYNNDSFCLHRDGVSGIINFHDDMSISSFKLFNELKDGVNTNLIPLSDGFLLKEYKNVNFDPIFNYYDKDYKLLWKKEEINLETTDYLYETSEKIVFANFGQIIEFSKKDGSINYSFKIELPNCDYPSVFYNEGILYAYNWLNRNFVNKYDLNGNLIASIDLTDYYFDSNINNHPPEIFAGKDLVIYEGLSSVYVLDNDGNLLNEISKDDILYYRNSSYFEINEFGYTLVFSGHGKNIDKNGMIYAYQKYNLNHEVEVSKEFEIDYGYKALSSLGFTYNNEISTKTIIDGKFFEILYTPNNNGTEVILIYE